MSNPFGEEIFRATVAVPGNNEATIIPLGTSMPTQRAYKYALAGMQLQAGDDVYVIPISGTYVLLGGAVAGGGVGGEGSLPTGGADGDILVKDGAADYAAVWASRASLLNGPLDALAIVTDGNTNNRGVVIPAEHYLYVRGHSTLPEGLYRATEAIPAGDNITAVNAAAVSGGGLNQVTPISLGGTGGTNSLAARQNLGLGTLTSGPSIQISAKATTNINLPNNARALLIAFGNSGFSVSANVTSAAAGSVVSYQVITAATTISFATSPNTLSVTNNSTANITCAWIEFSGRTIT